MSDQEVIISLDALTAICGKFSCSPWSPNCGYNCEHPDCRDGNEDEEGKFVGACFSFTCPLAVDMEDEGYQGSNGDSRMRIYDKDLLLSIKKQIKRMSENE